MTKSEIIERAASLGFYCYTFASGDGATLYRFGPSGRRQDHSEAGPEDCYTVRGRKEASDFLFAARYIRYLSSNAL